MGKLLTILGNIGSSFKDKPYPMKLGSQLRNLIALKPLNDGLNPICYQLALLGAHHILQVSRIRVRIFRV